MIRRRLALRSGAVLVAAGIAAGCGGDGGRFDAQVADARVAIEAGDHAAADQALDALSLNALAARDDGVISDDELAEVVELIDSSRALLDDVVPPPTTSTTTPPSTEATTTEAPAPTEPDEDDDDEDDDEDEDDEGNSNGNGKKKGKKD